MWNNCCCHIFLHLIILFLTNIRLLFWAKTHSILRQNAFHFAAKRNPFCGKTQPILRQNATHFAAKRISLWGKQCANSPIKRLEACPHDMTESNVLTATTLLPTTIRLLTATLLLTPKGDGVSVVQLTGIGKTAMTHDTHIDMG